MEKVVVIGCPACGRRYRFDTGRFGTSGVRIRCRSCEMIMQVRVNSQMLAAEVARLDEAPAPENVPEPPPAPSAAREAPEASPSFGAAGVEAPAPLDAAVPVEGSPAEAPEPRDGRPMAASPAEMPALIADTDADRRRLLTDLLHAEGYTVSEVCDGIEARRSIATIRPQVAFLNAFLPNVLGVTLCSEIKSHPELADIRIVLIGSQYRRDRFVRDPESLYGADAFLDGSVEPADFSRCTVELLVELRRAGAPPAEPVPGNDLEGLKRLARIIAGDIILYNAATAEGEIAAGRFFETFADEIREGETLVARRFPSVDNRRAVFLDTLRTAINHHGTFAGISAPADSPAGGR
ncbi:MAG: response regulator [Acidobacteriota bacterium]